MNIFYIDDSPVQSAQWMVDKHVVKMIVESAQLLSTAHRILDGTVSVIQGPKRKKKHWLLPDHRENILYKATHVNHPSNVWTRTSVENYWWLVEHLDALLNEYTHRYGKKHKTSALLYDLQSPPLNLKKFERTEILLAMPKEYVVHNHPVLNYRNYYKSAKSKLHKWTNRQPPLWIKEKELHYV
jgi:hypothetical protein